MQSYPYRSGCRYFDAHYHLINEEINDGMVRR